MVVEVTAIRKLTQLGRVTHICVGKLTIIGWDNDLSPGRRHVIIWTNAGILLIGAFETHCSEILIEIYTFSFKKMHLKMSSGKGRPSWLGVNALTVSLFFLRNARIINDDTLTHWGRVTHICVSKLSILGSDNGLSPGRRQAIIETNAGILLIWPLGTNLSEILIEILILIFPFKKMRLKVSSAKRRLFCLGLNMLI